MEKKTFTRLELAELLVDGLGRATKAHSAGEIQKTLTKLDVFFTRDVVKDVLDDLVDAGRIVFTLSSFLRNGGRRAGRAYHSLELLERIKARGPEDPLEGLTGHRAAQPEYPPPPVGRETLVDLTEEEIFRRC